MPPQISRPNSGRQSAFLNNDNDNKGGAAKDDSNDNGAGAGALISLSREGNNTASVVPVLNTSSPVKALVETRSNQGKGADTGKFGRKDVPSCVPSDIKKERTLLRSLVVHNNKRSEGDFVGNLSSKEKSGKKRLRTSNKEVDPSAARECHE